MITPVSFDQIKPHLLAKASRTGVPFPICFQLYGASPAQGAYHIDGVENSPLLNLVIDLNAVCVLTNLVVISDLR
jgi:hypothetical protein